MNKVPICLVGEGIDSRDMFLTLTADVTTIGPEREANVKELEKGVLIVLEGIDGGGKTSQAKELLEILRGQGFGAVYFREPSDSSWGKTIREKALENDSLTPEEELALFQNDRRENVEKNLRPALAARRIVILDRYYFSTMAYQGAKGLDPDQIRETNEGFAVLPDLVFILDVDPARGLKRTEGRQQRDLLFEREDYLVKVRAIFQGLEGDEFFHLDALRPMEDVAEDITRITLDFLAFFTVED